MRRALISDIHGNLEALTAVLADIERQGIDEVYCLGDIVGYGPNPRECLELAADVDLCLLGNYDAAVFEEPFEFGPSALDAILWTRTQLVESFVEILRGLPRLNREKGRLFVHASPRDPTHEYVFKMDVHDDRKMEALFDNVELHCFQGHTHSAGVFTRDRFLSPGEFDHRYPLGTDKLMVNVGSVGQPRDGDPKASYVVLTDDEVLFRRVEYAVEATVEKIHTIAALDNSLADRLLSGD